MFSGLKVYSLLNSLLLFMNSLHKIFCSRWLVLQTLIFEFYLILLSKYLFSFGSCFRKLLFFFNWIEVFVRFLLGYLIISSFLLYNLVSDYNRDRI